MPFNTTIPEEEPEEESMLKKVVSEVEFKDINEEIGESGVTGPALAFMGQSKAGKTTDSLLLGYLQKKYIPLLKEAGLDNIVDAIESNSIPEVKKIYFIDSENAMINQISKDPIKSLCYPLLKDKTIKVVKIPINVKKVLLKSKKAVTDLESAQAILDTSDIYENKIQEILDKNDNNSLIVLDSASRFKKLLNTKTGIIKNWKELSIKNVDSKGIGIERWQDRNQSFDALMTKMHGHLGWTVCTFMVTDPSAWCIKAFNAKVGEPVWCKNTEYNFDMIYEFQSPRNGEFIISIFDGRYVPNTWDEDMVEFNKDVKEPKDVLKFLKVIDNMCKRMKEGHIDWEGTGYL